MRGVLGVLTENKEKVDQALKGLTDKVDQVKALIPGNFESCSQVTQNFLLFPIKEEEEVLED